MGISTNKIGHYMAKQICCACFRASVKYGAIITELKGSVGGHTFKGTKSGGSMQTKINRAAAGKNGGTVTQSDAARLILPKSTLSQNAQTWRSIGPTDQATWITAAPSFPFINK